MKLGQIVQATSIIGVAVFMMAAKANATIIDYNTSGSVLSCNGLSGCSSGSTATSSYISLDGLTLTYNDVTTQTVNGPTSFLNLGNIITSVTGSPTGVTFSGATIMIDVTDTSLPGGPGALPNGLFAGSLSFNGSALTVTFAPNNTTTPLFGTLPGVVFTAGGTKDTFQVYNVTEAIVDPVDGNPTGQTSIQGAVTESSSVPEPATLGLFGAGLLGLGLVRRKRSERK